MPGEGQATTTAASCSAPLDLCRAERENLDSAVTLDQSFPLCLSGMPHSPLEMSFLEVEDA